MVVVPPPVVGHVIPPSVFKIEKLLRRFRKKLQFLVPLNAARKLLSLLNYFRFDLVNNVMPLLKIET